MAGEATGSSSAAPDPRIEALKAFKDWSNYLLITTVAAIGWIAKNDATTLIMLLALWSLGISAVFGIFALALVPLIFEQMDSVPDHSSIFAVPAKFYAGSSRLREMYLPQACRPQHLSFIAGVVFYCLAATGHKGPPIGNGVSVWGDVGAVILTITFAVNAVLSHRRPVGPKPLEDSVK